MKQFNNWLAQKLASALSSMTFFYVCVLLDLVELPPVIQAHDIIVWCTYLAQTVFQLIALPILASQASTTHEHHEKHHKDMADLHRKMDRLLRK